MSANLFAMVAWAFMWAAGGWLLAEALFRLRKWEAPLVGLGFGLVLEVWLANLVARLTPVPYSFWIAAAVVLLSGILAALLLRQLRPPRLSIALWLALGVTALLFNAIGRGLAIFDDYQNLPTISLMAAGDVPPHFALNPSLTFGYHYFLLLFCAELMRVGGLFPWSALDLGRALILALPLILAGMWGYRITRSRLAGFLTALMLAFAGGTRWLMLLLPAGLLAAVSGNITLIGSAASTAPTLSQALLTNWKIDGAGPLPFPFAFYTGINQPYIMAYTGIAGSGILIIMLVLLTAGRWRHWGAGLVTLGLLAALAIANEISFLLIGLGFCIVLTLWIFQRRPHKPPRDLLIWLALFVGALVLAVVQGGLLSDLLGERLRGTAVNSGYFDASPVFVWPPALVSAHLGSLSLFNLAQLFAGLLEIGPVILATPLLIIWSKKCLKLGKWYEASLIAAGWGTVLALFVAFKGPLFTATPRLMGGWLFACILYSVPLSWIWLRGRSDAWKIGGVTTAVVTCLGGLVLFGAQLAAVQKPVYATFITPMDAKMTQEYWNRLVPGAWVFDPVVYRAPTVFGRFTDSSPSWYSTEPSWQALSDSPDPSRLRAAGFSYMYFDGDYWNGLNAAQQMLFDQPCVKQIAQVNGIHSEKDYTKDFRRLLDIQACR